MYEIFEKLINERGITPYKVWKETGVSQTTLSEWKKGTYTPKLENLQKIADFLEVDVDYLLGKDLPYCPFCGVGYNKEDPEGVKTHQQIHDRWKRAVDEYGFVWPYKVRESIKHRNKRIVENKNTELTARYQAAINVLKAYFSRSVELYGYGLDHPDFHDYVGMLLY